MAPLWGGSHRTWATPGLPAIARLLQQGPYPQLVDQGEDCQWAGAQWALFHGLRDEGCLSLGEKTWPVARIHHHLPQPGQLLQGLV